MLLRFPTAKLLDYSATFLAGSANPFAVIVGAHLQAQQTRQNVQSRYREKLKIAKSLYQRGHSRQDILELFWLIDWMMALPDELESDFRRVIKRYEEENQVPQIFTIDSMARMEMTQENIIDILTTRFDEVPRELENRLIQVRHLEQLKKLHKRAVTIASLEEFEQLVEQAQREIEEETF